MLKKITSIVMAFAIVIAGVTYTPRTVEAGVNSGNGNGGWKLVWSDEFDQGKSGITVLYR